MVASLTRLMPPVIAKRKKRRLKCAFTVRRAILSCRAISALSQPWSSSSAICCSRGPSRIELSFIPASPLVYCIQARFGQLWIEVACVRSRVRRPDHLTDSPDLLISPKIHSMHTAKLPVNFHFQRKMWIFSRVSMGVIQPLILTFGHTVSCLLSIKYPDLLCFVPEPSPISVGA